MKSTLLRSAPAAGLLAVALAVSAGGGAVAASLITGAQIKNGTVTTADIKNHNLKLKDFASSAKSGLKGATGATGSTGATGATGATGGAGPQGPAGTARAWGSLGSSGVFVRQSGGLTATNPMTGVYCITVPGLSNAGSVLVAIPDYSNDTTSTGTNGSQVAAETRTSGLDCDPGQFEVKTFIQSFNSTTHDETLAVSNQGFTFIIA